MTELIVALDAGTLIRARELIDRLHGTVTFYKIGIDLFTAHGRRAVDLVKRKGGRVFLDLKLHDVPGVAASAIREAQKLGIDAASLHLLGGADMIRAAVEVSPRPKLWGVGAPAGIGAKHLREMHRLGRVGWACGVDALICQAADVEGLRRSLGFKDLRFVAQIGGTPEAAARMDVDAIVVGRPITAAPDPLRAAQEMLGSIKRAWDHEKPSGGSLRLS
ncbi:MAG: orotidine 5'-phosphate decarboxylase / HUMPS family protein [Elusimicrobiota bacterium]